MKSKGLQPRLLYPAGLSITMESEIRSFPDRPPKKAKRIHLHKTSIARDVKGTTLRRGRNREGEEHRCKAGKMAMSKYLSIRTLNENGLNSSIKRHRVAERIRKHDLHICCL